MMIIKNSLAPASVALGISDRNIRHQRGMITKKDIRLMALARLELLNGSVLWDIGAGSGSLSIEAANLNPGLEIYAIEKNEKRYAELLYNIKNHRAFTVEPVYAKAPEILQDLPAPDSVFIGGTGGELQAIMATVKKRLSKAGTLVINCVTLETLSGVLRLLKRWGWHYEVVSAQHAYLARGSRPEIFRADTQVFIVHGRRQKKD
jgi:precorrin-6Y C5,15-methyltransferase (decarboxylating)